ncbi:MAG: TRAP transporter small permease subunit [Rhodobacteraceae bacterium]|nr:TRAP transporter small permease subunit [Paracoccaceae bacterium]
MKTLLAHADAIDAVTRLFGKIATALLLVLIVLIGWNVGGRYIIGGSSVALQELEWHLLGPIALLGVTVLMLERGHVRVDMLFNRLPPRAQHMLDFVSMICGAVIAVMFIKYSVGFVESAWSIGEGSPDPGGLPARYILKATLPVGFALFGLQCLANAIRHLDALIGGEADRNERPVAERDTP